MTYAGPLPKPTPDSQPYWDGLRQNKLMLQRCTPCGQAYFYPRPFCPHCGSREVAWFQAGGRGTLYSYSINHRPPPWMQTKEPYVLAVVQLEEGPRMLSNIVGTAPDPALLPCDRAVVIEYESVTPEVTLPRFRLA